MTTTTEKYIKKAITEAKKLLNMSRNKLIYTCLYILCLVQLILIILHTFNSDYILLVNPMTILLLALQVISLTKEHK